MNQYHLKAKGVHILLQQFNHKNECTLAHRGCFEFPKHASSAST